MDRWRARLAAVVEAVERRVLMAGDLPDFTLDPARITGAPLSGSSGDVGTISVDVVTSGGTDAVSFVGLYLSDDPQLSQYDPSIGTTDYQLFPANSRTRVGFNFTLPVYETGHFYPILVVNPFEFTAESDETNNAVVLPAIDVVGPDLFVSSVTAPSSAPVPGTMTLGGVIGKSGGDWGGGGLSLNYYLSSDTSLDPGDQFVGSAWNATFSGAIMSVGTQVYLVPPGAALGDYHLLAVVDEGAQVAEPNEQNNVLVGPTVKLIAPPGVPDLAASFPFAKPGQSVAVGTVFTGQVSLRNYGGVASGPFNLGVYLSADGTFSDDDVFVGSVAHGSMAASGSWPTIPFFLPEQVSVTMPQDVAPGWYHVFYVADCDGKISEFDETNNAGEGEMIEVFVPAPLDGFVPHIEEMNVDLHAYAPGDELRGSVRVTNFDETYLLPVNLYLSVDDIAGNGDDVLLGTTMVKRGMTLITLPGTEISGYGDFDVTLPGDLKSGAYHLVATAQNGAALVGPTIAVEPKPDLTMVSADAPATVTAGMTISVHGVAHLSGEHDLSDVRVRYALVRETAPGVYLEYYDLGDVIAPKMAANSDTQLPVGVFKLGDSLPAGAYRLSAIIDPIPHEITESDELNNELIGAAVGVMPRELSGGLELRSGNLKEGERAGLRLTLKNETDERIRRKYVVTFYLSSDAMHSADDLAIGSKEIEVNLKGGKSGNAVAEVKVPAGVSGSWYLIAEGISEDRGFEVVSGEKIVVTAGQNIVSASADDVLKLNEKSADELIDVLG